jgi:hypothetical protein
MPMIGYIQANSEQFANIGKVLLAVVGIVVGVVLVAFAALVVGSIALTAAAAVVVVGFVALIAVLYNVVQVVWDVFNNVRDALGGVIDWFENVIQVGWDLAQNLGSAIADGIRWVSNLGNSANEMAANIAGGVASAIGWFVSLPGRIASLVRGFESAIGGAKDRISGGIASIRNLFPFSPAKEGPFSGRGWTTYSGQAIAEGLAAGMLARGGLVYSAADTLTRAAQIGPSGFGPSSGSGLAGMAGVGGLAASGSGGSAPGAGLTVNLYGIAATKADVGRALDEALREYQRSGGTLVTAG